MRNRMKNIIIFSFALLLLGIVNYYKKIITIPEIEIMVERQIDFITINTVFAGFSFTALSLLLGLSSEKLIERIKNTSIVWNKIQRLITSIFYFISSVLVSLIFVLGIDKKIPLNNVDAILYILGLGYMIIGIIYFCYSVYEMGDLLKRIYNYNENSRHPQIVQAKKEMENVRRALEKSEQCDDKCFK